MCLIVNPAAAGGRPERLLPAVRGELARRGQEVRVARTRSIEHARELGGSAAEAGELALTLGGDGLVGCVAGAVSAAGGLLGVLPGGRGNDFARSLGTPLDDIAAATAAVLDGEERRLDLGEADGRPFVGIASGGFDSDANRIANEARLVRGDLVYAYAALRALATWRPARFTLAFEDRTISYRGYSFAAANSAYYGGGMHVAPDARLDDGLLEVLAKGHTSRRRFLLALRQVFDGTHLEAPSVRAWRAREVRVSADRPFTLYADGDPIAELPATIRVRAGALRTLVPR